MKGTTVIWYALVGLAVGAFAGVASGLLRNEGFDLYRGLSTGAAGGLGAGGAMLVVFLISKRSA
jgi:hypothetical protein